jgi:hypothetical protein
MRSSGTWHTLAALGLLAAAARPAGPADAACVCPGGRLALGAPAVERVDGDPTAEPPTFPTATLHFGENGVAYALQLEDGRWFDLDEELTP